jgi:hypothetical protein
MEGSEHGVKWNIGSHSGRFRQIGEDLRVVLFLSD